MSEMQIIFIILAACLVPIVVYILTHRKTELEKRVERSLSSGSSVWSPLLVDIARESGTAALTGEQIDAIDTGLQFTFDKAAKLGWRRFLDHSVYTIVILKGELYKGINCLRLPNGDWVAGIVIDLDKRVIAIPEHRPEQREELARIVGYECEHIILYNNNREEYERTKIHLPGEGHPIL